jgi:hypothetical protein
MLAVALALASGAGLAACDGTVDDVGVTGESETVTGELRIVQADEANGKLTMEYAKDGRTIRYQLQLGQRLENPPTAEDLAINPELPTYDYGATVFDADGQPFHVQAAPSALLDPAVATRNVVYTDTAGRLKDIQLTRDAVPALKALRLPAALEQLRLAAIQIGRSPQDAGDKPELASNRASGVNGISEVQSPVLIAHGPSSVRSWDFEVRKKCINNIRPCIGDHSAVHLRGWSADYRVVYNAYSSNHGTSASDTSVMKIHCTMPGFKSDDGTHSRFFMSQTSSSQSNLGDACQTPYAMTSRSGHHNCNDDSELEGRAITRDRLQNQTTGSCSSGGLHNWAPGCSY